MAINRQAGVLLRPVEFKWLGKPIRSTKQPGTRVTYYRHPMQPGVFVVELPGRWFATLPAVDVPTHIEEA